MTERDAQEIIRMIESNWHFDLASARGMWRTELLPYEVEPAIEAVASIARNKPGRIDLFDLTAALRNGALRAKEEQRSKEIVEQGKRGHAAPEWVWVWSWARSDRQPIEDRAFPQQRDWVDPDTTLSQEDYEGLRQEWVAAGSPKAKNPIPLAR